MVCRQKRVFGLLPEINAKTREKVELGVAHGKDSLDGADAKTNGHRVHLMLTSDRHGVPNVELRRLPIRKLLRRAAVVATEDCGKVLWGTEAAHLGNLHITQFGMFGE
jgi:hypothetical protein